MSFGPVARRLGTGGRPVCRRARGASSLISPPPGRQSSPGVWRRRATHPPRASSPASKPVGIMEQALVDVLMTRSFPELAGAVRAAVQHVVPLWVERVQNTFPAADELTFAQVRDDLPIVLEHMARALEANRSA